MEPVSRRLDPFIGRFADALAAGDIAPAADALAERRGADGVALPDALDDLSTAYRIVTGEEPSGELSRRFAVVWSEAALGAFIARGALDHRTGLATTDYLATRLRDLARSGESATRRLVVADGPDASVPRFPAMLRSARVARELAESFPRGETPVGLPSGRVAVIAPEDEAFDANLIRARIAVRTVDSQWAPPEQQPVRESEVATIELPEVEDTVTEFVTTL